MSASLAVRYALRIVVSHLFIRKQRQSRVALRCRTRALEQVRFDSLAGRGIHGQRGCRWTGSRTRASVARGLCRLQSFGGHAEGCGPGTRGRNHGCPVSQGATASFVPLVVLGVCAHAAVGEGLSVPLLEARSVKQWRVSRLLG